MFLKRRLGGDKPDIESNFNARDRLLVVERTIRSTKTASGELRKPRAASRFEAFVS